MLAVLQVSGIFLIFLWLFVDQQFIQMGRRKQTLQEIKPFQHLVENGTVLNGGKSRSYSNLNPALMTPQSFHTRRYGRNL